LHCKKTKKPGEVKVQVLFYDTLEKGDSAESEGGGVLEGRRLHYKGGQNLTSEVWVLLWKGEGCGCAPKKRSAEELSCWLPCLNAPKKHRPVRLEQGRKGSGARPKHQEGTEYDWQSREF